MSAGKMSAVTIQAPHPPLGYRHRVVRGVSPRRGTGSRRSRALVLVTLGIAMLIAGCADDNESSERLAKMSTVGIDESGCETLLSGDDMSALTGDQEAHRTIDDQDRLRCQALISETGSRVTVWRVPASEWVPFIMPSLDRALMEEPTGDAEDDQQFVALADKVQDSIAISDDEACQVFEHLTQVVDGSPPGTSMTIDRLPKGNLSVAAGQACSSGVYTLLEIESLNDISESEETDRLLGAALSEFYVEDLLVG